MVVVHPPDVGPFSIAINVTTGESYVNALASVPIALKTETHALPTEGSYAPFGVAHNTDECVTQDDVAHVFVGKVVVKPILAVREKSADIKFIPINVTDVLPEGGPLYPRTCEIRGRSYVKVAVDVPIAEPDRAAIPLLDM